jgi:hydroxypyruvate isomerase
LRETFVTNLRFASQALKGQGIKLLVEAINTFDIPGFYLSRTQQALDLIDAAGGDNLYYQYDIYHMQRMEGELAATIKKNLPRIAHMQLADNPGRNEPGSGEINYPYLFDLVDSLGYEGWIGCEYKPAATTSGGLSWLRPYLK